MFKHRPKTNSPRVMTGLIVLKKAMQVNSSQDNLKYKYISNNVN